MKRAAAGLLALIMLLSLGACGEDRQEPYQSEAGETYCRGVMESSFPIGLDGTIAGVAESGGCLFVGGNSSEGVSLVRMEYSLSDGKLEYGAAEPLELGETGENTYLRAVAAGDGKVFVLLYETDGETVPAAFEAALSYTMKVYTAEGGLCGSFPVEYPLEEIPRGLLVTAEGDICVWSNYNLRLFSQTGELISAIKAENESFCPPMLLDGKVIVQLEKGYLSDSRFCRVDWENGELLPLELGGTVEAAVSRCQSADGAALLNDGERLLRIGENGELEELLNWYAVTEDYGNTYRCVCRLGEEDYLLTRQNDAALVHMQLRYAPPERTVRIGLYGRPAQLESAISGAFRQCSPDHKVEFVNFGDGEQGRLGFQAALSAGDIDIAICNMGEVDPSTGFVDLYPFIDGDESLSREDFPEALLQGLEKDGELNCIWGAFCIGTMTAQGVLAEGPTPLRLADCGEYAAGSGAEEPLLRMEDTKSRLLYRLADTILDMAYDAQTDSFSLNKPEIRRLLELCNSRPLEDASADLAQADYDAWYEDYWSALIQSALLADTNLIEDKGRRERQPMRLFDGSDGGDIICYIYCAPAFCYMIPETCPDRDNAWSYLSGLLSERFQTEYFCLRHMGLPSNIKAHEAVVSSFCSDEMRENIRRLELCGFIRDYDAIQLSNLLNDSMQRYFNGDQELDGAMTAAEGRLNIYYNEHK